MKQSKRRNDDFILSVSEAGVRRCLTFCSLGCLGAGLLQLNDSLAIVESSHVDLLEKFRVGTDAGIPGDRCRSQDVAVLDAYQPVGTGTLVRQLGGTLQLEGCHLRLLAGVGEQFPPRRGGGRAVVVDVEEERHLALVEQAGEGV